MPSAPPTAWRRRAAASRRGKGGGSRARALVAAAGLALAALLVAGPLANLPGLRHVPTAAATVLLPVAEATSRARQALAERAARLSDRDALAAENARLREENANLQVERAIAQARVAELQDATALGAEIPRVGLYTQAAPVLGPVLDGRRRQLWIGLGASDGVRPGQVVLGPEGVAGMVSETTASHALVQLISDPQSRWGAEAAERGESGVVHGAGKAGVLELRLEATTTRIEPGDIVTTNGRRGSTAPPGIPLGRVLEVGLDATGEHRILLQAATDAENLRHVFILSEEQIAWNP